MTRSHPQAAPGARHGSTLPAAERLGELDLLGRMPIPLRRAFKAGIDQTVAAARAAAGHTLNCCCLGGGEWYSPFDTLATTRDPEQLPGMLVSTIYHDILAPSLLEHYAPATDAPPVPAMQPACVAAGLADPLGVFQVFSAIPFVWLVDQKRLKGRPAPRVWRDLLDPCWHDEIVFGGWRPNPRVPYQDYNGYLLLALQREFGHDGLSAFAANVRHLQHNVRTATQAGSNSRDVGAIAVLPWLQAELCPRRERTAVLWPQDGALVMPIGYMLQAAQRRRLAPLVEYLSGSALGEVLARNCYPPVNAAVAGAFPAGARLKWPGWDYFRSHDVAAEQRAAADFFFAASNAREAVSACN